MQPKVALFVLAITCCSVAHSAGHEKIQIPEITSLKHSGHASSVSVFVTVPGGGKFGNALSRSGKHWYITSGFLGDLPRFVDEELGIKGGSVLYITDDIEAFKSSSNPQALSRLFLQRGKFEFAVCALEHCQSEMPKTFRQYYDEKDRKIAYPD
jgi:hypothetical protein